MQESLVAHVQFELWASWTLEHLSTRHGQARIKKAPVFISIQSRKHSELIELTIQLRNRRNEKEMYGVNADMVQTAAQLSQQLNTEIEIEPKIRYSEQVTFGRELIKFIRQGCNDQCTRKVPHWFSGCLKSMLQWRKKSNCKE